MYYYFIYLAISNKQANKRTNEQTIKLITIISIAGIDHQKSNAIQEKGYTHFML